MDPRRDSLNNNAMPEESDHELTQPNQADIESNQSVPLASVPVSARPTVFTPEIIKPTVAVSTQNTALTGPDYKVESADSVDMPVTPTPAISMSQPVSIVANSPELAQGQITPPAMFFATDSSRQEPVRTTSFAPQPQPVAFSHDDLLSTQDVPQHSKSKKKPLLIGGSIGLMLILVGTGVFGFYLPNRPNAVWNTGINRTGKALNTVVATATEKKALETLSTSKISGEVNASFQDVTYKGTLTSKFKGNNSDSGLTVTIKSSESSMNIGLKALTEAVKDSSYPNAYFQFTGLKELGLLDLVAPGLSNYEDKWISIPSATYQKWMEQSSGDQTEKADFSSADIAEIAQTTIKVTNDYVFSTDPEKAVLKQNSFEGKETVDDMKTYHYKVSINKEHAKNYCTALVTEVTKTKAFKNLTGYSEADIKTSREDGVKSCKDSVTKDSKVADEYDMWIDAKYKLIYKIRVNDKETKGNYQEVGQRYTGGDALTFFYNWHDVESKADAKATFTYNTKTFVTTMSLDGKSTSKESPFSFDAKVTFEPSKDEVKVSAPKDAVPIETILQQLGMSLPGAASSSSDVSSGPFAVGANDSQRQADINALSSHLEAYYALNGYYPTLAQVNNASWRSSNLRGLVAAALADPEGGPSILAGKQTPKAYAYVAGSCDASGCGSYTVIAQLSDGTAYEKNSF